MYRCFYFLIVVLCFISSWSKAKTTQDSTFYFETLTQQIGVRVPKLRQREYQIRFWVNTSLMFGEAQELYVITHKKNQLHLQKFEIWNNKSGYLKHIVTFQAVVNDKHCPKGYAEFYKETKELEQPLNIIQLIFNKFRESNKRICHVPVQSYNPFTCI